jgi:hypothetical protein
VEPEEQETVTLEAATVLVLLFNLDLIQQSITQMARRILLEEAAAVLLGMAVVEAVLVVPAVEDLLAAAAVQAAVPDQQEVPVV